MAALLAFCAVPAGAVTVVPPGNRNADQPDVPAGAIRRTSQTRGTFDAKYEKIRNLIATNDELRGKIDKAARAYGIDPIHIVGALVGEHTYNVDALDRMQTYYVKALSYLEAKVVFAYEGESVTDFVARPEFRACAGAKGDEALWSCRESVFNTAFRGRTVDGRSYPDNRFGAVFFQPFYAGQTFGLGQINPLTALGVSDLVHRVSGYPDLDPDKAPEVYRAIMDPDRSLAYMAAVIRSSIEAYREIAGVDISGNPGITATLYNVGNPRARAAALAADNKARAGAGQPPRLPEENYYGWLVNDKLPELEPLAR
ncbi:hypothetical protein ASG54_03105 [Aureimonas sp. Leaf460]|uniref:DUF1402 family protein n=1 Tax=Aureimonas sp. Leaf460 TaxID=1736384 RepID=UPI0006F53FCD|nr:MULTISPECIES: DUF1402 family protein [unclassified Aureimonas]KQT64567.1 hypothetical protein ASG62_05825 [Aureimonas sp. Leaf427]KQT81755.1 hypothetical protein ASG54_03105 [Aureimonas sp. Leaf460]